jgi:hypothetical protein
VLKSLESICLEKQKSSQINQTHKNLEELQNSIGEVFDAFVPVGVRAVVERKEKKSDRVSFKLT